VWIVTGMHVCVQGNAIIVAVSNTNTLCNVDKYILKFEQIHFAFWMHLWLCEGMPLLWVHIVAPQWTDP